MLSKILRNEQAAQARAFVFRSRTPNLVMASTGGAASAAGPAPVERRIAELERAAAQREEAARAQGRQESESEARRQARAATEEELGRLAQSVTELAGLRARLRREAEADLVRLSITIAGRILRREITLDPESIGGIVAAALGRLAGQEVARVRVHPAHEAFLRARLQTLAPGQNLTVSPDSSLAPGGVVFETARGKVDASIEAQLAEIERGLSDRLAQSA